MREGGAIIASRNATMPSRKRNKGKARKEARAAAAQPAAAAAQPTDSRHQNQQRQKQIQQLARWMGGCRHGCMPPEGHTSCDEFADMFYENLQFGNGVTDLMKVAQALGLVFQKFPEIWTNETHRHWAVARLQADGVNMILNDVQPRIVAILTAALHAIEKYDPISGKSTSTRSDKDFLKNRDLTAGCERSLVQYFRQRIPCSCLDEKYAALQVQPKTGPCGHCRQVKERSALKVCSGCNREQYCSRDCQAAHWPEHKEKCKKNAR